MITVLVVLAVWIAVASFFITLAAMAKYGDRGPALRVVRDR